MGNGNLDYVNPYTSVIPLYRAGMDTIINCITASSSSSSAHNCDCSNVSVESLINCVCQYITSAFNLNSNTISSVNLKAIVSNAINGYLDNEAVSARILNSLQSVPVKSIGGLLYRMGQNTGASPVLKGPVAKNQLTLSIGQASYEYWKSKINSPLLSPWAAYFDGNTAIDTASIPYWVVAAMFGSEFNFYQGNANDSDGVASAVPASLAGALVVGAGIVIFDWAPKE